MADKNLGIYWGKSSFTLVDLERGEPKNIIDVPFSAFDDQTQMQTSSGQIDGVKFTALIQQALRENNITADQATLSLPSETVILRAFTIPYMKVSELEGVVSFEAKKYIPFALEEIKYTFQTFDAEENGAKKLLVIFIGVRLQVLDSYRKVLEDAGLTVTHIEPAVISTLRVVNANKLIKDNERMALIQLAKEHGKITIIENGLPQFVRDFSLQMGNEQENLSADPEMLKIKFFNEVRVSLDFYARQNHQQSIEQVLILADTAQMDLWEGLSEDIGKPVNVFNPQSILKCASGTDIGAISAYGANLQGKYPQLDQFNLIAPDKKTVKRDVKPFDVRQVTLPVVIAVALYAGIFFWAKSIDQTNQENLNAVRAELGVFADKPLEEINAGIKLAKKKIGAYETIPIKSESLYFMVALNKLLPPEMWLTDFKLDYEIEDASTGDKEGRRSRRQKSEETGYTKKEQKVALRFSGKVFHEDANKQILIVNDFVAKLRSDEDFSTRFESIQLENVQSAVEENFRITQFGINCL